MGWLDLQNEPLISLMTQKALTTFAVTFHTEIVAFFGLPDVPRPNARAVIDLLQRQGIQVHIVSGDAPPRWSRTSRESWASRACVRSVAAYPQSKLLACAHRALQATGAYVMFIGEGTNNTPALAAADIGIAMGSGTDVARSVADAHPTSPVHWKLSFTFRVARCSGCTSISHGRSFTTFSRSH
ncbi:HAD-like domain-containing protein [Lactifluus volemus]|nr:HAD-like domain-containing protein [Lactifluus volemus]